MEWSKLNGHHGKSNIPANQLSHPDQVLPTRWSLLPWVFDAICAVDVWPLIYLFSTRANAKLPLYMSPVSNPTAWKQDASSINETISVFTYFPLRSSLVERPALNQHLNNPGNTFGLKKSALWIS